MKKILFFLWIVIQMGAPISGVSQLLCEVSHPSALQDAVRLQKPLQHEVTVVNIEVPVRVFDGDLFVDNLTMADFEVFENGVLQKVEAAYLIRKTTVLNNITIADGPPTPVPIAKPDESIKKRRFVLIFEMDDYLAQMGKAIDMFFTDVLTEDDTVQIVAPDSTWAIPKC